MAPPGAEARRAAPAESSIGRERAFNRFEIKYLLHHERMRAVMAELGPYTCADPHSGEGGYRVHSVYWDSPELTFFWEKIDGQKFRRKLRFRAYGDGESAYIEIKQRTDRTIQKRRSRWPLEDVRALFGGGHIDPALESEVRDPVAAEALFLCRRHRLRPVIAVAYRRRALLGLHEPDLRITFDTRLQYDARALDPGRPLETGKAILPPTLAVMEVKFDHRVPLWLVRLAQRRGLDMVRISKYCSAIDRELFGGHHT